MLKQISKMASAKNKRRKQMEQRKAMEAAADQ
jgi:hypothetical protein